MATDTAPNLDPEHDPFEGRWVFAWLGGDEPWIAGPYRTSDDAYAAAREEWRGYFGGTLGGYDTGSEEEFDDMYNYSGDIWVVPLDSPVTTPTAPFED